MRFLNSFFQVASQIYCLKLNSKNNQIKESTDSVSKMVIIMLVTEKRLLLIKHVYKPQKIIFLDIILP